MEHNSSTHKWLSNIKRICPSRIIEERPYYLAFLIAINANWASSLQPTRDPSQSSTHRLKSKKKRALPFDPNTQKLKWLRSLSQLCQSLSEQNLEEEEGSIRPWLQKFPYTWICILHPTCCNIYIYIYIYMSVYTHSRYNRFYGQQYSIPLSDPFNCHQNPIWLLSRPFNFILNIFLTLSIKAF